MDGWLYNMMCNIFSAHVDTFFNIFLKMLRYSILIVVSCRKWIKGMKSKDKTVPIFKKNLEKRKRVMKNRILFFFCDSYHDNFNNLNINQLFILVYSGHDTIFKITFFFFS